MHMHTKPHLTHIVHVAHFTCFHNFAAADATLCNFSLEPEQATILHRHVNAAAVTHNVKVQPRIF